MKKEKLSRLYKTLLPKLLLLLGFGTTFTFMACYGVAPRDYQYETVDDFAVDSVAEDSTVVVVDDTVAEQGGTVGEEGVAKNE